MSDPSDKPFSSGVQKILTILEGAGIAFQMAELDSPAHRATEAAELVGCPLGAVVKSLIFQTETTGEMILVLVSGNNRADPQRLQQCLHQMVKPASPADVLASTGYPVGSVPPFCGLGEGVTLIDEDLMQYDYVWASAGAAHILFEISPSDLKRLTEGRVIPVKSEGDQG